MKRTEIVIDMLEEALPITIRDDYFIIEDWGSKYGEDICIEYFGEVTPEIILKNLDDAVSNFDIDEYVDLWAESKGKRGVPETYSALLHAGEEYLEMITSWRDSAKDILDNVILKMQYQYRDGANYKQWNTVYTKGFLSDSQINEIIDCLDNNEYFIPSMIELPENRFSEYDPELDHIWFELTKDDFSYEKYQNQKIICTSSELLKKFKEAKIIGWHVTIDGITIF